MRLTGALLRAVWEQQRDIADAATADGFSLDLRTLGIFLLITVAMGGGAAWMTGSGLARGWRPFWHCALALLLVAAAVRFIHYALFSGTLLSLHYYAVDAVVVMIIGGIVGLKAVS